jgi:ABC-type Fe3+ transport system substrate-binding protein
MEIEHGARVLGAAADGTTRELRALGDVIAGGDFAVIWACSEREWDTAQGEGREPVGIPWPAEDVAVMGDGVIGARTG